MGTSDGWIAILCLAVGTFLLRYSFLGFLDGRTLPPAAARLVQLAVPAIFAALVIPLIAMPAADAAWTSRLPHMLAAVVTGIVAFRWGGMLLPILAGFGSLYLMRFLVG
ncbi:MAG TPA: AzlD domain-containing protein [Burkholderiaceae bacterium]|nr:AzlD domain-containing protein [Burkholderiaceae bacterium]